LVKILKGPKLDLEMALCGRQFPKLNVAV